MNRIVGDIKARIKKGAPKWHVPVYPVSEGFWRF